MKPIPKMRVVDIKRFSTGQIVTVEKMVPIVGRTVAQVDADELGLDDWGRERRCAR